MNFEELPEGWAQQDLDDVCEIIMGNSPPGESYNDSGDGMRFLQGQNEFGETTPTSERFTTEPSRISNQEDILVAIRATPLGIVNFSDDTYCVGRGVSALRPNSQLDNRYLYHYMRFCKEVEYWERVSTGSTYPSITKSNLQNLTIPIPPVGEQRAIADKLDSIFERVEETEEEHLDTNTIGDTLLQSCIADLVPQKGASTCETVSLDEVCKVVLGNSPPGESYNQEGEGVRFLQGQKEFGEKSPESDRYTTDPAKMAEEGDVLIAIRATPLGIINRSDDEYCVGRGVAALRPCEELDGDYLYYYMKIQHSYWEQISKGSTYPSITKTNLQNLPVPVPSLSIQEEIAERLQYIESRIDEIGQATERMGEIIDVLPEALLHKAFSGDLVTSEHSEQRELTGQTGIGEF